MFSSAKTSNIMQSLKPGGTHAAAADDRANAPVFEEFAKKAKVPPALVKAAFTNSGLNHPDGTFVHDGKDVERLKNYVIKKLDNSALQPQDEARLHKVLGALSTATAARLASFGTASRRRTPPAERSNSPTPPAPTRASRARATDAEARPSSPHRTQTAPAGELRARAAASEPRRTQTAPAGGARVTDSRLKDILSGVRRGDAAKKAMESAPDAASFRQLRNEAQSAYGEARSELLAYSRAAPDAGNKKAALDHGTRVVKQLQEVRAFRGPRS